MAISFLVGGWNWPADYFASLLRANIHARQNVAPNLHGLANWAGLGTSGVVALSALVAAMVLRIAHHARLEYALAAALAGGFLISPHLFFHDSSLLLPAALVAIAVSGSAVVRALAVALIVPPLHLMELALPFPWGMTVPIAVLAFLIAVQYDPALGPSLKVSNHHRPLEERSQQHQI